MRAGLTLVETLLAIVLVALVAAAASRGLSGATEASRLRQAGAIIREADAQARLLATQDGALMIRLVEAGGVAEVVDIPDTVLLSHRLPRGCAVEFRDMRRSQVYEVHIDARGRSDDYIAVVTCDGVAQQWNVAGLTGWFEESKP